MSKFKIEKYVDYADDPCPVYYLYRYRDPWTWVHLAPQWEFVDKYTSKEDAKLMIKSLSVKPYKEDWWYYDENGREETDDSW